MAVAYWKGQKLILRAIQPKDIVIFELLDDDEFRFIAVDKDNNIVGIIETFDCDRKNGTFDYYLAVFEPYRGKGYAKEMILMVLRFFFLEFAYQKVNTTVYSFNNPSMRLHEKLGFMQEGQLRNILFTKGAYYDGICYGMTRQEFELNHAEYYL